MHYKYIRMPSDWNAEQAWSVMEFIWQLEKLVWDTYEEQLRNLVGPDPPTDPQPDPFLNDNIPF
jgi:hypothetical protein